MRIFLCLLCAMLCSLAACHHSAQPGASAPARIDAPALPATRSISTPPAPATRRAATRPALSLLQPGVEHGQIVLNSPTGLPMKLAYLRPVRDRPYLDAALPVVLSAPPRVDATTGVSFDTLFLDDYTPWVRAGYAVVVFEIDGPLDLEKPSIDSLLNSNRLFLAADGGLVNYRAARGYIAAALPEIDLSRILVVGDAASGSLALRCATEPGVRGVVAFSPRVAIRQSLSSDVIDAISFDVPGFESFVHRIDPASFAPQIRVPAFLLAARDDALLDAATVEAFAQRLKDNHTPTQLIVLDRGGQTSALTLDGIKLAIEWASKLVK
jgi:dienelactone hydrolase